jgi:hypothetical protein
VIATAVAGMAAAPTRRRSADERREEILRIAPERFAAGGYHGTSTEVIAREAGMQAPACVALVRPPAGLGQSAGVTTSGT